MEMRTAAATVKSQDGVGNDWFGRNKRAVGPFVLGFFRARIGSQIEENLPGKKKPKMGNLFFSLDLRLHGKAPPGWTVQGNGK